MRAQREGGCVSNFGPVLIGNVLSLFGTFWHFLLLDGSFQVPQGYSEAIRLYGLASKQRHTHATFHLGVTHDMHERWIGMDGTLPRLPGSSQSQLRLPQLQPLRLRYN